MKPQLHIARRSGKFKLKKELFMTVTNPHLGVDVNKGGHKPHAVLWTSSLENGTCDWERWCHAEGSMTKKWVNGRHYVLYPKATARVYRIDKVEDVLALAARYPGNEWKKFGEDYIKRYGLFHADINWEEVAKDYDGVWLTKEGEWDTRLPELQGKPRAASLYGWDCESTAWFRDVFDKVEVLNESERNSKEI